VAQAQAFCDRQVARVVGLAQVRKGAAALSNQHQQTTAAGFIVLIGTQVLGELLDAFGHERDLDIR